ncbi:unnamed protein product, partial [Hapterophycus canaliculatus]
QQRGRERGQLPSIVTSILVHAFDGCRDEVRRRLQARVDGLRAFVGGAEAVYLGSGASAASDSSAGAASSSNSVAGGGGGWGPVGPNPPGLAGTGVMATDTQDLLYGELRRRYRTVAGLGKTELATLAAQVLCRAFKTEGRHSVGLMLVNRTWPSFEPVMRSYLALFVE